jgi:hypothetical protein
MWWLDVMAECGGRIWLLDAVVGCGGWSGDYIVCGDVVAVCGGLVWWLDVVTVQYRKTVGTVCVGCML